MLGWAVAAAVLVYAALVARSVLRADLAESPYASPDDAEAEVEALARAHPELCRAFTIGHSREGRPLRALRLRGRGAEDGPERPRLLVTAWIHAVEFIGGVVARSLARRLLESYDGDAEVRHLLDRADVVVVPLLNPDGARRVWRAGGYGGLGFARFTAAKVDPNRNFPFVPRPGRGAWNSGRSAPGSPYYRGPHPLSEPECRALADLAARERFCAAVNFHSFGGVVFFPASPELAGPAAETLAVFEGEFQWRQPHRRYRPVAERPVAIAGQLDAFLLEAFGTPSVTVEVSRPSWQVLRPSRVGNVFWISNPERPERWVENDRDATVHALAALLERSGGRPVEPARPELAEGLAVDGPGAAAPAGAEGEAPAPA